MRASQGHVALARLSKQRAADQDFCDGEPIARRRVEVIGELETAHVKPIQSANDNVARKLLALERGLHRRESQRLWTEASDTDPYRIGAHGHTHVDEPEPARLNHH